MAKDKHLAVPKKHIWNVSEEYYAYPRDPSHVPPIPISPIELRIPHLPANYEISVVAKAVPGHVEIYIIDPKTIFVKKIPGGWNAYNLNALATNINLFLCQVRTLADTNKWE